MTNQIQEPDIDYIYLCEKEKDLEVEEKSLFVTDQNVLSANSWNLLLKKESAINKYKQQQKELIKEIFKDDKQ